MFEFDELMCIPGCTLGKHSNKVPEVEVQRKKELAAANRRSREQLEAANRAAAEAESREEAAEQRLLRRAARAEARRLKEREAAEKRQLKYDEASKRRQQREPKWFAKASSVGELDECVVSLLVKERAPRG